ncbi:MAG: site-specific integrase [Acidimicrobiales bacterium]
MSVHRAADRWKVRWREPDGKERAKRFDLKRDASSFATRVRRELDVGSYQTRTEFELHAKRQREATVRAVARRWLELESVRLKPTTVVAYESIIEGHIEAAFGTTPVSQLDARDVQQFVAGLTSGGRQPRTVRNVVNVLRPVLELAVSEGLVDKNPADGVRLPPPRTTASERMVFAPAEELIRLATELGRTYSPLVLFAAFVGLRAGELHALRVGDVDSSRGRVTIRRSVEEVRGRLVEGTPKNGRERTVGVPPEVLAALSPRLLERSSRDLVFTTDSGGQIRHSNFYRRHYRPAVVRCSTASDLPKDFRFHDLRHSCAALLIAEGAHPRAIMERLGHSSISVTLDTYGHLFPSIDESLTAALDTTIRAALEGIEAA